MLYISVLKLKLWNKHTVTTKTHINTTIQTYMCTNTSLLVNNTCLKDCKALAITSSANLEDSVSLGFKLEDKLSAPVVKKLSILPILPQSAGSSSVRSAIFHTRLCPSAFIGYVPPHLHEQVMDVMHYHLSLCKSQLLPRIVLLIKSFFFTPLMKTSLGNDLSILHSEPQVCPTQKYVKPCITYNQHYSFRVI